MQKLIEQVKKQRAKEALPGKKAKIKAMLEFIEQKEDAINDLQKGIDKLKEQLKEEDFSAVEPVCSMFNTTTSSTSSAIRFYSPQIPHIFC